MIDPAPDLVLGVDLGGTNLRVAAFRGLAALATRAAAGEVVAPPVPVASQKEPVGDARDPAAVIARIAALVPRVAAEAGVTEATAPVGIGIAAMLRDRRGTVANAPNLGWRDVPFGAELAARLGARHPVGVYNDVNAIAYGEFGVGAGAGASNLLAVFVGTGIGGGLVVDGHLAEGSTNCAGEVGHMKVRWGDDAAPCACGGRGCVEAYVGGANVLRRIRAELAGGAPSLAARLAGRPEDATPSHVDEAAAQGDPWALELWTELAPLLGVTLANAACVLNPDRLVLGGGLLGRTPVLRDLAVTAMQVAAPAALIDPLAVVDAALGDDAGLIGAALLALRAVSRISIEPA